jgi:hypothetical protein
MLLLGLSILNPRLLNSKKLCEMVLRSLMHQLLAKATLGKLAEHWTIVVASFNYFIQFILLLLLLITPFGCSAIGVVTFLYRTCMKNNLCSLNFAGNTYMKL